MFVCARVCCDCVVGFLLSFSLALLAYVCEFVSAGLAKFFDLWKFEVRAVFVSSHYIVSHFAPRTALAPIRRGLAPTRSSLKGVRAGTWHAASRRRVRFLYNDVVSCC